MCPVLTACTVVQSAFSRGENVVAPDDSLLRGHLKNSESLQNLDVLLAHLTGEKHTELAELIKSYPSSFGDAPSKTQVIERDTDDAKSVRQRFYRVSEKRKVIDGEVECRLDNHIAVHSPSSWASLCLLVEKSDKSIRRCTDYRKDFPRVEDCIDQVGAAKYGNKFSLLKGTWQVPITPRAQTNICFHKTNWPVLIYSQGFWLMERTSYISTTHEYGS